MIDIHCHILPIDDGAKNIEEAIEMAKIAQQNGIKKIINTSHFNPDFEYITGQKLQQELNNLNKILKEQNIDVEILIGNELYYNESLVKNINNKNIDFHTLNNSKYILLEFPTTRFPNNLCEVIYEFKIRGYKTILAHIERYIEIQQDPNLITKVIEEGAYIQINASSVLNKSSNKINQITQKLLQKKQVHIIASDAHSQRTRSPKLKQAYEHIKENYGQENADILFIQNPQNIIEDKELVNMKQNQNTKQNTKKGFFKKIFKNKI